MVTKNAKRTADGELHPPHNNNQQHQFVNGFAPYRQPVALPPMHPLAPPPKKAKRSQSGDDDFTSTLLAPSNSSSQYLYPPPAVKRTPLTASTLPPMLPPPQPPVAVAQAAVQRANKPKPHTPKSAPRSATAKSSSSASKSAKKKKKEAANPQMQNPYSTSRGLRHFSMKVCEKVEEKGTTTYNEVADEVRRSLVLHPPLAVSLANHTCSICSHLVCPFYTART